MQDSLSQYPFYSPSYPEDAAACKRKKIPRTGRYYLFRNALLLLAALLAAMLLGGCSSGQKKSLTPEPLPGRSSQTAIKSRTHKSLQTPAMTYGQYADGFGAETPVFSWPPGFERVAMLPIYTEVPTGTSLPMLDETFRAECAKVLDLEVIQISRNEMMRMIGEEQIASTAAIPEQLVRKLQEKYAVQGVIFTDMPIFRPYRPINIGVRSKLVQVPSMEILWSADGILDSAEPGIAASALQFAERNLRGPEKSAAGVILQSPTRYAAFVANGLYGTLPGQKMTMQQLIAQQKQQQQQQ